MYGLVQNLVRLHLVWNVSSREVFGVVKSAPHSLRSNCIFVLGNLPYISESKASAKRISSRKHPFSKRRRIRVRVERTEKIVNPARLVARSLDEREPIGRTSSDVSPFLA